MCLAVNIGMKTLLISNDSELKLLVEGMEGNENFSFQILENTDNPIEIISTVCSEKPGLLILDDDSLEPNTVDVLKSIKKLCKNTSIVFFTSNDSVELGRQISPLGLLYYGIKPIVKKDFIDVLKAI